MSKFWRGAIWLLVCLALVVATAECVSYVANYRAAARATRLLRDVRALKIGGATSASPWSLSDVSDTTWFGIMNGEPSLFTGSNSNLTPSSSWPTCTGEPQKQSAGVPTSSMTVNFSGYLSQGDNLVFPTGPGDPACSQTLGLQDCMPKGWFFNVEVTATVSDDASNWKVHQHAVGRRTGNWKDTQGGLHPFQDSFNTADYSDDDNPCTPKMPECDGVNALQQTPGQRTIFWIDDPGSFYKFNLGGGVIDSLNSSEHFTSRICNRFNICASEPWFFDLIVDPGSNLDWGLSAAGPAGNGP